MANSRRNQKEEGVIIASSKCSTAEKEEGMTSRPSHCSLELLSNTALMEKSTDIKSLPSNQVSDGSSNKSLREKASPLTISASSTSTRSLSTQKSAPSQLLPAATIEQRHDEKQKAGRHHLLTAPSLLSSSSSSSPPPLMSASMPPHDQQKFADGSVMCRQDHPEAESHNASAMIRHAPTFGRPPSNEASSQSYALKPSNNFHYQNPPYPFPRSRSTGDFTRSSAYLLPHCPPYKDSAGRMTNMTGFVPAAVPPCRTISSCDSNVSGSSREDTLQPPLVFHPPPFRVSTFVASRGHSDHTQYRQDHQHNQHHHHNQKQQQQQNRDVQEIKNENLRLRQEVDQKDSLITKLYEKLDSLEQQISELRQLPTGKISHIPIEDMIRIMQEYGSEVSNQTLPKRKQEIQKASIVRQFRRWNPEFFRYFVHVNGEWVPKLGREGELKRRVEKRISMQANRKSPSSTKCTIASINNVTEKSNKESDSSCQSGASI